jgi:uncharacterized repeat protein (TIGR02543 family)
MSTVSTKSRMAEKRLPIPLLWGLFILIGAIPGFSQTNLLTNSDFATNLTGWTTSNTAPCVGTTIWEAAAVKATITTKGTLDWHQKLYQTKALTTGQTYIWQFKAKASAACSVNFAIEQSASPYGKPVQFTASLTTTQQTFAGNFNLSLGSGNFNYSFFGALATGTYYIDDCKLYVGYTMTATPSPAAGGSVAASSPLSGTYYASGSTVTLTAAANAGYTFTGWSGGATGPTNPVTVTMNANKTVTATFSPTSPTNYTLTTAAAGTGSGTIGLNPTGGSYASGSVVTLTATPNAGSTFTS